MIIVAQLQATTNYTLQLTTDELYIVKLAIKCLSDGSFEDTLMSDEISILEQLNRLLRDTV